MYNFITLNPSGNITAVVLNQNIEQKDYKAISNDILNENKDIEQVGFFKKNGDLFRLEMMGMEFCGNASRAFACLLFRDGYVKENSFYFSISGIEKPISASVKPINENLYFSSIKIPFGKKIDDVVFKKYVDDVEVSIVYLDGITHVLIDKNKNDFEIEKAKYFIEKLGLTDLPAVGVIWFDEYKIQPVVWVKNTDTYYYENACGSGSLALAIYYASLGKDGEFNIVQKNNEIIVTSD